MKNEEVFVAGEAIAADAAQEVILGYTFGDEQIRFDARQPAYGEAPELGPRPKWAYRLYDCILPSGGSGITRDDILLISGINGDLNRKRLGSLLAVLDPLNHALARISEHLTFWNLKREHIEPAGTPPEGTDSWWMHRAWWLLMGLPDVGPTTTHKILHHKRPEVFPLVDRDTLGKLGNNRAWVGIHDDLTSSAAAWESLEDWFEPIAAERGGVRLTRLRLHDILLWASMDAVNRDATRDAGRKLLGRG